MAAAYAAIVSLVNLMEQIQLYHAYELLFLNEQQKQLDSLNENVVFLQQFLESYSHEDSNEAEYMESRIADAAYAAEDIIESHIVDDIHSRSKNLGKKSSNPLFQGLNQVKDSVRDHQSLRSHGKTSTDHFSEALQKVTEDMDFIKSEIARKIQKKSKVKEQPAQDQAHVGSLRRSPRMKEVVVIFEDDMNHIMNKLTREEYNLQIIPITGMGGIGKTTLAKNVYENPFNVQFFDIRGWITISQEYNERGILLDLLREIGSGSNQNELESLEYHQLGEKLYKYLTGRSYLIIMDDMWSITAWEKLRMFFPDNINKSRIIVTTRLSTIADYFGSSDSYKMNLLDESKSWNLLCQKVFFRESCPPELEEIGKQIAKKCKGLPLSISVIGGLLASSNMTREYWEYIASDINTIVNLQDDARCLKILSMSYNHLPIYLKPCFLYFGIFPEDNRIRVSRLIKLWVAEGFIRPSKSESLEKVAKNHLKDLVDRNLIFVSQWGSLGQMKWCKIHDLLRDLCLSEAQKGRFLCVNMERGPDSPRDLKSQRRIVIHHQFSEAEHSFQVAHALRMASLGRSLICSFGASPIYNTPKTKDFSPPPNSMRLLRILDSVDEYHVEDVLELVNSRFISFRYSVQDSFKFPSSTCLPWNLQTLIVDGMHYGITAPPEIWEMPQLRHLIIYAQLPYPRDDPNGFVLENLQTLSEVINLGLFEEIVQKIPNIRKLKLQYRDDECFVSEYCLLCLGSLHKLESLVCKMHTIRLSWNHLTQIVEFPLSLKKLTLIGSELHWEDLTAMVGSLPNLEKLKLTLCCDGEEWNPVEGQFLSLKYLYIYRSELVHWRAEETHFPRLECLVLQGMQRLEEIPSGIGDISTLQSIYMGLCSSSSIASAKRILQEQQKLGNDNLLVMVDGSPADKDTGEEEEEEEEEETRGN